MRRDLVCTDCGAIVRDEIQHNEFHDSLAVLKDDNGHHPFRRSRGTYKVVETAPAPIDVRNKNVQRGLGRLFTRRKNWEGDEIGR